jgi:hypothetical protein
LEKLKHNYLLVVVANYAYLILCSSREGDGMKTLKIENQTHQELTKVKGALMAKTGDPDITYDHVIMELIARWNAAIEGRAGKE